ncbi:MAG: hypothetical protein B2I17_03410 [Thermoplasmatales archaeon B_DKE]|nr:MAG: hypothetical protein B2I17_03410 [Thermoplasmatales archaeon B_DKE]
MRLPGFNNSQNQSLKGEIIRRFELDIFEEADATKERFVDFYNNKRSHTGIGYVTPGEMNLKCME